MEIIQKEVVDHTEEDFSFEGNREDTTFFIHMLAGSCAGLMEHVAIYPMDTIKTHMQTSRKKLKCRKIMNYLYQEGGWLRLWKGSLIIGCASVPAHAMYFSAYEVLKEHMGVNNEGFQFLASAATGAIATCFHDSILTPADVLKQRIQLSGTNKYMEIVRNIIKTEGIFSFYRSLPITLLMGAPYSVTTVMVNENLKKVVQPKKGRFPFLSYFFCAAVAGSIASAVTCPMDNIKTKLQTQSICSACDYKDCIEPVEGNGEQPIRYRNMICTVKMIYRQDGFLRGFFRGVGPRIMSMSPSCAISWGTYEVVKHFISNLSYRNK